MNNINRQRGLGMLGMLATFMVIAVLATVGIKIVPLYLDNFTIAGVLQDIAEDPMNKDASLRQLRDSMERRLVVNSLDEWVKEAKFIKEDGKKIIELNYERRETFMGNVDVVVIFENRIEI